MTRRSIRKNKNISNRIKSKRKTNIKNKGKLKRSDPKIQIRQKLQDLGFATKVNNINQIVQKKDQDEMPKVEVNEEFSLEQIRKVNFSQSKPKITQDEGFIIKKLYKKYGTEYKKMHMDHKVNTLQWTPVQIKKKFEAYQRKFGDLDQDFKFFKEEEEE